MNSNFKLFFLILLFSLCSCSHLYYAPNTQNVPMFKEKNELKISASVGKSSDILAKYRFGEIQCAYSITDKLAVMANFLSVSGQLSPPLFSSNSAFSGWASGYSFEGAFGFYKPIKKEGNFAVFGGFGSSRQHHTYGYSNTGPIIKSDLSFYKLFVQPSYGLKFKKINVLFSSQFSRLNYYDMTNNFQANNSFGFEKLELDKIMGNKTSCLFEPAVTLRFGTYLFKGQLQYVYSWNLSHSSLQYGRDQISLGLYISIGENNLGKDKSLF